MLLQYNDISVKKQLLLSGGALEIDGNGIYVISGRNGSGKSLLLRQLFFILKAQNYDVRMMDQENFAIFRKLPVQDNIGMGLEDELLYSRICEHPQIKEIFDFLQQKNPKTLSGGEKRLIAFLRCIVTKAPVLLLDEPTNDLDYRNVERLVTILQSFQSSSIIIIVSHDDRIRAIADREFFIKDKRLEIASGKKESSLCEIHEGEKRQVRITDSIRNRILKRNSFCILPALLIILFLFYSVSYFMKNREVIPAIESNRVDIYISGVSSFNTQDIGAIPAYMIFQMEEGQSILSYFRTLNHLAEETEGFLFQIDFHDTDLYKSYPMEYFNTDMLQSFYSFTRYLDRINYDAELYYVDSGMLFRYISVEADPDNMIPVKFDAAVFEETIAEIEANEHNKVSHTILLLEEEVSLWDVIQDDSFKELTSGHCYIRSNETIEFMNQVNKLSRAVRVFKLLLWVLLLASFLDLILIVIYLFSNESKFTILINYGVEYKQLKAWIREKNNILKRKIEILLIFCVFAAITASEYTAMLLVVVLLIILTFAQFVIMQQINNKIIAKYCGTLYDWRHR